MTENYAQSFKKLIHGMFSLDDNVVYKREGECLSEGVIIDMRRDSLVVDCDSGVEQLRYGHFFEKLVNTTNREKQVMKLDRNDKCLCGSGKKYKNCCLPVNEIKRYKNEQ